MHVRLCLSFIASLFLCCSSLSSAHSSRQKFPFISSKSKLTLGFNFVWKRHIKGKTKIESNNHLDCVVGVLFHRTNTQTVNFLQHQGHWMNCSCKENYKMYRVCLCVCVIHPKGGVCDVFSEEVALCGLQYKLARVCVSKHSSTLVYAWMFTAMWAASSQLYAVHVCMNAALCVHVRRSLLRGSEVGWSEEAFFSSSVWSLAIYKEDSSHAARWW